MASQTKQQIKDLEEQLRNIKKINEALQKENTELKLRASQFNSILDSMHEAVERDAPNMDIIYVNKAFCDFYGTTQEKVLYTDTMNLILPEDRKRIDRLMEKVTPKNPDYHYTCRIKNKEQDTFWIEVFGHAFFDENGNLKEYQDISRDITAYKEAERQADWFRSEMEEKVRERTMELTNTNQQLIAINGYLQSTLNNITEGIIILDQHGDTIMLNYGSNPAWSTDEKIISDAIRQMMLYDSKSPFYQLIRNKENFSNVDITIPSSQGDIQYIVSGSYLQNENGEPQGLLIFRPLAEMKHLINKFSGTQAKYHFHEIIGESAIMKDVIGLAQRISASEGNVMIEGESGTGKELFAQSIHNASLRKHGPFIAVNCGAIPRDLIASELFGYTEGSFTGAKKGGKPGKFEMASGGTIFLDEIGDMPLEQQITLLRAIQERTVTRIGDTKSISIDVRIICATNKDLLGEVRRENFRQDLYYRLNVINLHIPPLRERKEDIPLLFKCFFSNSSKQQISLEHIADPQFLQYLADYSWPGNVRELQNITERAYYVSHQLPFTVHDLPKYITDHVQNKKRSVLTQQEQVITPSYERFSMMPNEKEQILRLLNQFHYNASHVAKEMGISRTTLYRKLKKYDLMPKR